MQASIVKGALVKTALAELLEATVKLPKDETDLLQASFPPRFLCSSTVLLSQLAPSRFLTAVLRSPSSI